MSIQVTTITLAAFIAANLACGGQDAIAPCPSGEQRVDGTCTPLTPPEKKKASISEFFSQPDRKSAGQKFVNRHPDPGKCYVEGSLSFAQATFSQAQTDALATSGALPVGTGWFLVVSTADGATWRASCSSAWKLNATSLQLIEPTFCGPDSGTIKPTEPGRAVLSLGRRDETGELVHSCAQQGSLVLESRLDGTVAVTVNAQMTDGSSVTDAQFLVPGVF